MPIFWPCSKYCHERWCVGLPGWTAVWASVVGAQDPQTMLRDVSFHACNGWLKLSMKVSRNANPYGYRFWRITMDKITQVLFSILGKSSLNMLKYHTSNLNRRSTDCARVLRDMRFGSACSEGGHPFAKPPVVPGHEIAARVRKWAATLKMYSRAIMLWSIHHGLHGMPSLQSRTF